MIEKMNDSFYTKRLLRPMAKNARVGKGNPADAQLERFCDTNGQGLSREGEPGVSKNRLLIPMSTTTGKR